MDRDEILQRVTDLLCGELGPEASAELDAALAANPDIAAEAQSLKLAWQQLGKLAEGPPPNQALLARVFNYIASRDITELSDEDLDMAAGGIWTPDGPQGGDETD